MIKLIQYRNKCIGCGICYEMQPNFWRMSKKDGKATLLNSLKKKEIYQAKVFTTVGHCKLVVKACPVNAIKVG